VLSIGLDNDNDAAMTVQVERIELDGVSVPITGTTTASGGMSGTGTPYYTVTYWLAAKLKAGEPIGGYLTRDTVVPLPAKVAPMKLERPRAQVRGKTSKGGPFVIVNSDVGLPVFPYDFPDVPFTVVGEIRVAVRDANQFSASPSQAKVYAELWERAVRKGADAVIDARYADVAFTFANPRTVKASGTAIRFDIPVEGAAQGGPKP
jgi:hypothetical protein